MEHKNTLRHFGRRSIKHANTPNLPIFIDRELYCKDKDKRSQKQTNVTCNKAYSKSVVEEMTIEILDFVEPIYKALRIITDFLPKHIKFTFVSQNKCFIIKSN